MKLTNEVHLGRPSAEVFDMLLDVQRVAGCMPGSTLTGKTDEDTYAGEVSVKVGPLGAAYTGTVRFLEVRREERAVTLKASGKEKSGQGNADAHVVARVVPSGDGCTVAIETDLTVRGKVAQFGRGVIGEVSQRLIDQFASNVERELAGTGAAAATTEAPAAGSAAAPSAAAPSAAAPVSGSPAPPAGEHTPEPASASSSLDGLGLIAAPVLKRFVPVACGVAAGVLIGLGIGRTRGKRGRAIRPAEHAAYLLVPLREHDR